jgi:hypothetical protein
MSTKLKNTYKISPAWVAGMIASAGLLGWLGYYYSASSESNDRKMKELTQDKTKLAAENSKLSVSFSNAKLNVVRAKTNEIKEAMPKKEAVEAFIRGMPKGWAVVSKEELPNKEFTHRRYKLSHRSINVKMWPEIKAFFMRVQKTPGLAVDMFDIQTVGDNRNRNFVRIIVGISIYVNNEG